MNLLDELLNAKTEFLQEEWDKFMIQAWKTKPNWTMAYMRYKFIEENKIDKLNFSELKRTPKFLRHYRCRITRYIAAYLPTLSTCLWNGNKTDEELLQICSKSRLLNIPVDNTQVIRESTELIRAKGRYEKAILERDGFDTNKEKTNRSNWGAAKI
jgi:hypothetical protein